MRDRFCLPVCLGDACTLLRQVAHALPRDAAAPLAVVQAQLVVLHAVVARVDLLVAGLRLARGRA
eukprot:9479187-Pyramimonas_sp.AAC.1